MPTTRFDLISSQKVYIAHSITHNYNHPITPLLHLHTYIVQVFSHEDKVYRTESKLCNEQKHINNDAVVNWTVIDKRVDDWYHNMHRYLVYKFYLPCHSAPDMFVCVLEHSKPSHLSVV